MYRILDKRTGLYRSNVSNYHAYGKKPQWDVKAKAKIYRSLGACKMALYSYSTNPDRKMGAKIMLPPHFVFEEVTII